MRNWQPLTKVEVRERLGQAVFEDGVVRGGVIDVALQQLLQLSLVLDKLKVVHTVVRVFTLYTFHLTLYILHLTYYTLHLTPTLHFTYYTLHSTLYTLHFTYNTLHFYT